MSVPYYQRKIRNIGRRRIQFYVDMSDVSKYYQTLSIKSECYQTKSSEMTDKLTSVNVKYNKKMRFNLSFFPGPNIVFLFFYIFFLSSRHISNFLSIFLTRLYCICTFVFSVTQPLSDPKSPTVKTWTWTWTFRFR